MAITESVETEYAGQRFRSRLESRWAVFFDAAGIRWEYEPHGLLITGPLRGEVTPYLPDFRLPETGHYAECKGFLWPDAFARTMRIARALTAHGYRFAVLGHLPSVWTSLWPCELVLVDGELAAVPWEPFASPDLRRAIREPSITASLLLEGFPIVIPEWSEPALEVAKWYQFPPTSGPRDVSAGYGRRYPADRHAPRAG